MVIVLTLVLCVMAYLIWPKGQQASPPPPTPTPTTATSIPSPTEPPTTAQPEPGGAPSVVPTDLPTLDPPVPTPTPTVAGPDPVNPGYDPENGRGGFIEPRTDRPAVEAPDATPAQTWPSIPDPGPWQGEWTVVSGERGLYQVPAEWSVESPGTIRGYQTMGRTVAIQTSASYGPKSCQGNDLAFVGLLKPAEDVEAADYSQWVAHYWALLINTEWEGDYYLVPKPVTTEFPFTDGTSGYLSTVTFVPKPAKKCDFPAVRVSVVMRSSTDGNTTHGMVAVSEVGKDGELGITRERQVLSTFRPNE